MRIRVNPKTGVLYMPKELVDDGFKGEMEALGDSVTLTIIHPGVDLQKVKESLEIRVKDIQLRLT